MSADAAGHSAMGTLIVVGGPTAIGKTHVAATLAQHYGTEVVSADSRQFYHAMRIGTARPSEEELLGVKHHFLGHLELDTMWSAGEFARHALPVIHDLLARKRVAVMVGGSGLYIDAVCYGLDPIPLADHAVRERLQERFQQQGLVPLLDELEELDPDSYNTIDRMNPHRVIRALEVCLVSGRSFSSQRTGRKERDDMRIVRIALELPRTELYQRIDARVDRMIADGLVEEARALLPFRGTNALRTVGYRELFDHFDGSITPPGAIDLIKQHTRNYAKRQGTWLRRDPTWKHVDPSDIEVMTALIDAARSSERA